MKIKIYVVIVASLLVNLAMFTTTAGQSINFTSPTNGSTYGIPPGQSTVMIQVRFNYQPDPNPHYVATSLQCRFDGGQWQGLVQLCGQPPYYYQFDVPVGAGSHTVDGRMLQFNLDAGGCGQWQVTANATSVNISVVQQYAVTTKNNFDGGSIIIDGTTYTNVPLAGITRNWNQNSTHNLTAINNQNVGGYVRVFDMWLKDGSQFATTLSTTTSPVTATATYTANFRRLFNVTVSEAQYVEPGSGGTYKVNGTNVGSTWSGTFLEGTPTPILLEAVPPSGGWVLYEWSDGSRANPRQLTPTNHVIGLRAKFKLHLASSSANAIAPNTQRKIVRDASGNYHMVYESGNEIFYTRSTDGGATWSPERKLSGAANGGGIARSPSVTVQDNPHLILAVWQEVYTEYSYSLIMAAGVDPSTGIVNWTDIVAVLYGPSTTTPVVASGIANDGTYSIVVWYDPFAQAIQGSVRQASDGQWFAPVTLHSGGSSQLSVAPISVYFSGDTTWSLVWVENADLYYGGIRITGIPSFTTPPEMVADGDPEIFSINNPSVASLMVTTRGRGVTWEEYDPAYQRTVIKYRERPRVPPWSTVIVWASNPKTPTWYRTPSFTGHYNSRNAAVAWRSDASQLRYVRRDYTTWTSQYNLGTGVDPAMSVGWTSSITERTVSRSTASIYNIQQHTITYAGSQLMVLAGLGQSSSEAIDPLFPNNTPEGRSGTISSTNGKLRLAVLAPTLNGDPIGFPALSDTPRVIDQKTFEAALRSEAFTGEGNLQLFLLYSRRGGLLANANMSLLLLDASSNQPIVTLGTIGSVRDTMIEVNLPLVYSNRPLRLAIRATGIPRSARFELERWFVPIEEANRQGSLAGSPSVPETQLPTEFALQQNYPNPFNPSTVIRYQLPEAAYVTLRVYDVLGREVKTLVDEAKDAGYYKAVFDASPLGSGVYFYRMQAGTYTAVKKLLVIK